MPIRGIRGQALADELLAAYDALEEMFRDAFLQQIATLSRSRALKDLLDEIDAGDLSFGDPIDSRLESLVISQKRLDDIVEAAMETGARVTQKVVDVGGEFNVLNPAVRNTANNLSVQLSTTLNSVTRQTISDILRDAIEGNITTLQAARKIRSHIGLLPQHSKAVDKYLNKMLADGVAKRLANKRADEYAERLLKYRSETIARTEIARAMGEGQTEYWKQMASEGYLPPNAKRIWMTSRDELVCPICGPMDGVEADIDGYWTTINGEAFAYPQASHPNCRCSSGIVFPKGSVSKSTIEKANPYHDERGRFTSANNAVSGRGGRSTYAERRSRSRSKKGANVRYHTISDSKRLAAVEQKAVDGSSALLMPRHPEYGTAQTLPLDEAKKRYGRTTEEVRRSINRILGVTQNAVSIEPKFAKSKYALEEMLGVTQALEEAKAMGINVRLLNINFTNAPGLSDGKYSTTYRRSEIQSGTIEMNTRGKGAGTYPTASDLSLFDPKGMRGAVVPNTMGVENTQDVGMVGVPKSAPKQVAQKGAYAVMIHEIGHHLTMGTMGIPAASSASRLFREYKNSLPSNYARKDKHEMLAEGFAAWWLMGGSKNPTIKEYYRGWLPVVTYIIHGEGSGANSLASRKSEILKSSSVYIESVTGIRINELPPDHPIIVWLTNGASLQRVGY